MAGRTSTPCGQGPVLPTPLISLLTCSSLTARICGLCRSKRRAILAKLLRKPPAGMALSDVIDEDGPTVFEHTCRLGLEGIVSKRIDRPYRSGASSAWLKTKWQELRGVVPAHARVCGWGPQNPGGVISFDNRPR